MNYLVCAPRTPLLEAVLPEILDVQCCKCAASLAMDARNAPVMRQRALDPICIDCAETEGVLERRDQGHLIAGQEYDRFEDAAVAFARDLATRRKVG